MPDFTIKTGSNYRKTVAKWRKAPGVFLAGAAKGLHEILIDVASDVGSDVAAQGHSKTGTLARSVHSYGDARDRLIGWVGLGNSTDAAKYGWQLTEETKTITAKKKFLSIPIADNLTGAGVARFSSPLQVPDGFFFTSKKGNLLFAQKDGDDMNLLFAMKESVTVTGFGSLPRVVKASVGRITTHVHNTAVAALHRIGL